MKEPINRSFHIGGSIEKALKGEVELQPVTVLIEAWKITGKNIFSFLPAVICLFLAQVALLLLGLEVQLGSPTVFFDAFITGQGFTPEILKAGFMANFWSDVLIAPLYVGVSLMALNHAVGLPSKPSQIVKGFSFTIVSLITMLLLSSIQGLGSSLFPLVGLFLTMALSMAILLVCEKKVSPIKAIQYSFMATIRKVLPMTAIYIVIMLMFFISIATAGIGLIWTLPFFFNVKGIIYRNMFGVTLQVTSVAKSDDEQPPKDNGEPPVDKIDKDVFNA
ncbi:MULTISPECIES: hypothetical protein [unclassified Photobacterium]|uniref:hypothetical protein n=1 Tax=unclassified Photobacterium TaxID=2628852 RepID=UPI001EE11F6D|nr:MULTISPECIES: hypothetical protein [unclassified Photobacterium]MCG3863721.1 hypothetical protein [Photobacterium sp. Ph6]MCG3875179.1 hypothetical protein [Photobacterium sp. Ph5]